MSKEKPSAEEKAIRSFIGDSVIFDEFGATYLWGQHNDGTNQMIGEVRGWGAIQNMFLKPNGELKSEDAEAFQDALGRWIADAINQKLQGRTEQLQREREEAFERLALTHSRLVSLASSLPIRDLDEVIRGNELFLTPKSEK